MRPLLHGAALHHHPGGLPQGLPEGRNEAPFARGCTALQSQASGSSREIAHYTHYLLCHYLLCRSMLTALHCTARPSQHHHPGGLPQGLPEGRNEAPFARGCTALQSQASGSSREIAHYTHYRSKGKLLPCDVGSPLGKNSRHSPGTPRHFPGRSPRAHPQLCTPPGRSYVALC